MSSKLGEDVAIVSNRGMRSVLLHCTMLIDLVVPGVSVILGLNKCNGAKLTSEFEEDLASVTCIHSSSGIRSVVLPF